MHVESRPLTFRMPENALTLVHSFGYECKKHSNLVVLDSTIMFTAGMIALKRLYF